MTQRGLVKIMLRRDVRQQTIALLKLRQHARRFGAKDPPAFRTATPRELIKHFFDLHRLDLPAKAGCVRGCPDFPARPDNPGKRVRCQRESLHRLNADQCWCGHDRACPGARRATRCRRLGMANAATTVVAFGFGVGLERLLGRRRGRTKIAFVDLPLLIIPPSRDLETVLLFAQSLDRFLQLDALRTNRPRQSQATIFSGGAHIVWQR